MPVRDNAFLTDLEKVPEKYRSDLLRYRDGHLPQDRSVRAVLAGDFRAALMRASAEMAAVVQFIETHFPDFAYGSPEYMARWEQIARFEKEPPSGMFQ